MYLTFLLDRLGGSDKKLNFPAGDCAAGRSTVKMSDRIANKEAVCWSRGHPQIERPAHSAFFTKNSHRILAELNPQSPHYACINYLPWCLYRRNLKWRTHDHRSRDVDHSVSGQGA